MFLTMLDATKYVVQGKALSLTAAGKTQPEAPEFRFV
jgi:hypothetical protein